MNKKLIAAAVSAAVVAPVASQADVTVYGNVTNALVFESKDDKDAQNNPAKDYSTTDVSGVSSRLGVRASSDLGNGLTANGVYELAISSNNTEGFGDTRLATVGLSGGFGSVTVGQQWSSFYNAIGSLVSPNYSVAVGYGGSFRTGNTLKYTNSFGPVSLGVDIRVDDDEGDGIDAQGDGFGIGATISPTNNISIGVAFDASDGAEAPGAAEGDNDGLYDADDDLVDEGFFIASAVDDGDFVVPTQEPDSEVFGVAVRATFGNFWGSVGYQVKETDDVAQVNCKIVRTNRIVTTGTPGASDVNVPACLGQPGRVIVANEGDLAVTVPGLKRQEEVETEYTQLWFGGTIAEKTSWAVGFGTQTEEVDRSPNDKETDRVAFKVNQYMGGGFHLFMEHQDTSYEQDNVPSEDLDTSKTLVGMRLNF